MTPRRMRHRRRMGRLRRPYLPGAIFHLMARTLRRERRFTPSLRSAALDAIADAIPRSRSRLLAAAIMPNHLHMVVQQGERPLSALMQPLLRRLALLLQDAHGLEGPMFWRHYASRPCLDPSYARNAIVYTHLNPVRAGLCEDPADYPSTSHLLYGGVAAGRMPTELERLADVIDPMLALPLFATRATGPAQRLHDDYREFVARRLRLDRLVDDEAPDFTDPDAVSPPPSAWGQLAWGSALSPLFHPPRPDPRFSDRGPSQAAPDLATIARSMLTLEAPGLTLRAIRGRGGGSRHARVRHLIIRRAHAAGYTNIQIAEFLGLSESAVSRVICSPGPSPGPGLAPAPAPRGV